MSSIYRNYTPNESLLYFSEEAAEVTPEEEILTLERIYPDTAEQRQRSIDAMRALMKLGLLGLQILLRLPGQR